MKIQFNFQNTEISWPRFLSTEEKGLYFFLSRKDFLITLTLRLDKSMGDCKFPELHEAQSLLSSPQRSGPFSLPGV